MKEIMAVVPVSTMNGTKQALADAGISSVTAKEVVGRGMSRERKRLEQGEDAVEAFSRRLTARRLFTIVVPDKLMTTTVKAIVRANQRGGSGAGKIWVMPVAEAVRIRTGEAGDAAVDEI